MESKRKSTVLIIITIAVSLVVVLGATFAYFATSEEVGNAINAGIETAGKMYQFTAASTDKIEMNIAFNEMSETNVNNTVLKSDNATIDVSLASSNNETITTCTYDIVWVWDSSDMYTTPDLELPYTHFDSKEYNYEFSTKVDEEAETDLSKLTTSGNKVKLQEGLSITSSSTTATTQTHEIKTNIYNLPVEQTNLFNKNFKAHVTIDNLNCHMSNTKLLATYIKEDAYTGTNPSGTAGLYFHTSDTTSPNYLPNGAADNTYRYAGADADVKNYVCFLGDDCTNENNLYRIISVDSTTNQTKVIKATRLENTTWDDNTDGAVSNVWANASLQKYLNGTYLIGLGDKANKIVETAWKVGGYTNDQGFISIPKQLYDIEKADKVTYPAKIGLMYVSEYEFAALPECWTLVGWNRSDAARDYRASKGKDWILTSSDYYPWTISRLSDSADRAWYVRSDRGDLYADPVNNSFGVRPSFVLSSDVKITNATAERVGSKTNPMIIS